MSLLIPGPFAPAIVHQPGFFLTPASGRVPGGLVCPPDSATTVRSKSMLLGLLGVAEQGSKCLADFLKGNRI